VSGEAFHEDEAREFLRPGIAEAEAVKSITIVLHSRADDVVLFSDSEELIKTSDLPASALIEVGNDHRLAEPEPLEMMLRTCERVAR
jgi:hypothetical protein